MWTTFSKSFCSLGICHPKTKPVGTNGPQTAPIEHWPGSSLSPVLLLAMCLQASHSSNTVEARVKAEKQAVG